ncbi:MAG: NAD-dependent malic enzyme [Acidobacteriota bacterium]|nr:NAD-dependent malic enzyme [Acidobacteriota bacterium]
MSDIKTNASNSITIRIKLDHKPHILGELTACIGSLHGHIGAIDIVEATGEHTIRDFTIDTGGPKHGDEIVEAISNLDGVEIVNYSDRTFLLHLGGKIAMTSKTPLKTRDQLSMAYTPGVARICEAIHKRPEDAFKLTIKRNTVAIVSDGTAVLGLGDIGPEAAMPVMEGKAMLFKEFAGVDGWPICLDTKDVDEIVNTVKYMAPGFGGVNLEDISAPRCFEIERRLKEELNIPVFHDDQHGTAVVLVAGLINALKIVDKKAEDLKVVVAGVGAAGTACTKMMMDLGVRNVIGCDRKGALHQGRNDLNEAKREYMEHTNPNNETGSLKDVMNGADVFVGLSAPNLIDEDDVKKMNDKAIVFAMSNPIPEIMPEIAGKHAAVVATGRSDYPNQINNVLCFPGIFRGALDSHATDINEAMKLAASRAIAEVIDDNVLSADYIVPSVFDQKVAKAVAEAVKAAAIETGAARRKKD